MSYATKTLTAPLRLKSGDAEGSLSAVFSTFNVIDKDGDVVLPGAIQDGQAVPLLWSHDWKSAPVGRGTVRVTPTRGEFHGRFFVETTAGMDAYRTVKAMGDLQEYSWGFQVTEAEYGSLNGERVRFIKRTKLFEVSPVVIGAGEGTHTVDLKRGRPIAEARRVRMGEIRDGLRGHADDLDAILIETADPAPAKGWTTGRAELLAIKEANDRRLRLLRNGRYDPELEIIRRRWVG